LFGGDAVVGRNRVQRLSSLEAADHRAGRNAGIRQDRPADCYSEVGYPEDLYSYYCLDGDGIVDLAVTNPSIDQTAFPNTPAEYF